MTPSTGISLSGNVQPDDFVPARPAQALSGSEIHLWFFPCWPTEARRVAESAPLRRLLATYLDVRWREVRIERTGHGKPRVPGTTLRFNLSHSGNAVLVALSRRHVVGVDVELVHPRRRVAALAQRWFDPREAAQLAALPKSMQQRAFLNLWSCKEAVLKAHGRGIGYGMHRVVFSLNVAGSPIRLLSGGPPPAPDCWRVIPLKPDSAYVGALAWRGGAPTVRAFRCDAIVNAAIATGTQSG